jgi:branched-chain amino acid aminotransferase
MKEIIYLDGHLINADEAKINPADSGFLYGAGLFDTMRAYSGKIFLLDRHIERLIASARALGINTPVIDSLRNACNTVVEANKLDSARVRLTISSGHVKDSTILVDDGSGSGCILQPAG